MLKALAILILNFAVLCSYAQALVPDAVYVGENTSTAATIAVRPIYKGSVNKTTFDDTVNTKGLQQSKNIQVVSIPEVNADLEENYFVYPHSITKDLRLDFKKMKIGNYSIEVYDIAGKLLNQIKIKLNTSSYIENISFMEYPNAVYLIKIINPETSVEKIFRVIK